MSAFDPTAFGAGFFTASSTGDAFSPAAFSSAFSGGVSTASAAGLAFDSAAFSAAFFGGASTASAGSAFDSVAFGGAFNGGADTVVTPAPSPSPAPSPAPTPTLGLVDHVDYVAKRIYLSAATFGASIDTMDIYREVRALRRTNPAHQLFKPMVIAGGNIPKIPGRTYTPKYVQLLYGCRLVPYGMPHLLKVTRDTFTDDGLVGRDCFDRTLLPAGVVVDIDIDFPAVEIVLVSTTTGSGSAPADVAAAVWSFMQGNGATTGANLRAARAAAENAFAVSA